VRRAGTRHVVTFYGFDVNMLPTQDKRWLSRYRELFDKADMFLCEGPHMARQLIKLGCPEEKVRVHHLGVEVENIPYEARRWENGQPLRILMAATFHEKKGIPYALQALAQIQHVTPIEITIIGDATAESRSQRERRRIMEILDKNELQHKTRLLGFQPYSVLFEEAYKHHLYVSPSVTASNGDTEGGAPVALIDMIATGMPVISTSHCDIPEVVQYGIENWLVKERDVEGLVEKLQWLINRPKDWNQMLSVGRAHVEKEFNALHQGKRLGSIYEQQM
jgi:colanic acid/amylovoran biosynthesis glycosyltransferase